MAVEAQEEGLKVVGQAREVDMETAVVVPGPVGSDNRAEVIHLVDSSGVDNSQGESSRADSREVDGSWADRKRAQINALGTVPSTPRLTTTISNKTPSAVFSLTSR